MPTRIYSSAEFTAVLLSYRRSQASVRPINATNMIIVTSTIIASSIQILLIYFCIVEYASIYLLNTLIFTEKTSTAYQVIVLSLLAPLGVQVFLVGQAMWRAFNVFLLINLVAVPALCGFGSQAQDASIGNGLGR